MQRFGRRAFSRAAGALLGLGLAGSLLQPSAARAAPIPDPERAGHAAVPGGRVWYRVNGVDRFSEGKTPLLVIHGGPGFSHHYLLTLTDLAADRPVIFYDQLDSGNSDRPGERANWTVERFVAEVDALRDALGLSRVAVLGSSWGGTVAAEYAIGRPQGLVGLVLASPLVSTERWVADNTAYRQRLPEEARAALDRHEAAGTTGSPEYQEATMVFYRRHLNRMDPWPEELNRSFELANADLYTTMWGPSEFTATGRLKGYDASGRLGRIGVPALFVCGEHDEATPAACRDFAGMVPGARAETIPGASHTGQLEQRELFMRTLRGFLEGLD